jgi:class 3 adenylate cyclase
MQERRSIKFGVRGRLMLSYFAICIFALIGAAYGFKSLSEVSRSLDRITEERVPQALSWLEISRQAERVVRAAPALLLVTTEEARAQASAEIAAQDEQLKTLLAEMQSLAPAGDTRSGASVRPLVEQLNANLGGLEDLVKKRLAIVAQKASLVSQLGQASIVAQRMITPGERILEAKIAEWNNADDADGQQPMSAERSATARTIVGLIPQKNAAVLIDSVHNTLLKIVEVETASEIDVLLFPLRKSLTELSEIAQGLPENIRRRLTKQINLFEGLAIGPNSLAQIRREELAVVSQGEELLAANVQLSHELTTEVSRLVETANKEIDSARLQAAAVQTLNRNVLLGVAILSLVGSALIVWLYVGRNLIARLTALSDSMLAIAGGDLKAPLPASRGSDEIDRMAEALIVFRDTAVEVEKSNLREIEGARRRLVDAIENSSEGFAFYDADDRLVICNTKYRELLYPDGEIPFAPGMAFETIIRTAAELGLVVDAVGRVDEWVAERLAMHRNPGKPRIQRRRGDRWILVSERKSGDGGTVAIYSDITDLKQREEELTRKSNALEQLSNQLAKYLSPQVYDSIFSGRQQVKLVSQRKRLTVFFSDIAGFTQTTERLESEDVTRLLNQYLTEMSKVALSYGATIDKFVGDAIVIFFGDPETQGVKEDAIACVRMALAMRKRMAELQEQWKESGVEEPLLCRMGISTGVCTVGNFGSEDRMDYTIVGSGVNLAARLETACPPSEILISYETHAHVKDVIYCEEFGQLTVKGIDYPVATFRAIELQENLGRESRTIRAKLPHLQLEVDVASMSAEEQREAQVVLLAAVERLTKDPARERVQGTGAGPQLASSASGPIALQRDDIERGRTDTPGPPKALI